MLGLGARPEVSTRVPEAHHAVGGRHIQIISTEFQTVRLVEALGKDFTAVTLAIGVTVRQHIDPARRTVGDEKVSVGSHCHQPGFFHSVGIHRSMKPRGRVSPALGSEGFGRVTTAHDDSTAASMPVMTPASQK
ncbi:hypothetical protein ACFSC4_21940 [Deinococcus malanensis]|uniref:hypothetical protein n=1 Tax=Deinococcus malanensis TaxID=1706855 RepID=UPI003636E831